MTWIILALAAPFFWSLSNLFDKYALGKLSKNISDFIFFGSIGSALLAVILLVVQGGVEIIPTNLIVMAMAGGLLLNYSFVFYAKALAKEEASRVVPLFQTIPIFVLVIGYLFFNEGITAVQLVGFFVVFIGGVLLVTDKSSFKKLRAGTGFWLMLISSAISGVSLLFTDHVLESTRFITVYTYDLIGFSIAGVSLMAYGPWRKEIVEGVRKATITKFFLFLGNDAIDMAGQICSKFALVLAPSAALVAVTFGIQPFYVLVMGIVLTLFFPKIIREDISKGAIRGKLLGIVIIFVGVVLISVL